MALELTIEKTGETATHCTYGFGPPSEIIGTVRVEKASGDVEISDFSETDDGPSLQFYLAEVVPRIQGYHADNTYPDRDRWTASG